MTRSCNGGLVPRVEAPRGVQPPFREPGVYEGQPAPMAAIIVLGPRGALPATSIAWRPKRAHFDGEKRPSQILPGPRR